MIFKWYCTKGSRDFFRCRGNINKDVQPWVPKKIAKNMAQNVKLIQFHQDTLSIVNVEFLSMVYRTQCKTR
jgi:hypothetical protein